VYCLSRRKLVISGLLFVASSSVASARDDEGHMREWQIKLGQPGKRETPDYDPDYDEGLLGARNRSSRPPRDRIDPEEYYDPALLPPKEAEFDYPIKPVDPSLIDSVYRRQVVEFDRSEDPGTVVIDPKAHFLFHVLGGGQAMRYGVGVGRTGFGWSGNAEIRMKRRWPRWVPPKEMVHRDKRAKKWAHGQPGGPGNPLGARALYLYSDGKDTLYRIHGTTEPESIGKSVSSGCIRMLNEDVADLFDQVMIGTKVIVRA
jgi:lipoprotein-anchoring transpeptidase ErfK/SrfK